MSQVGESAKIHQDRRQQENPKQMITSVRL